MANERQAERQAELGGAAAVLEALSRSNARARLARRLPAILAEAPEPDLDDVDWRTLEPASRYARRGRVVLEALVLAAVLPLALLLALPIALVNLAVFRRLDRVLYRQERMGLRGRTFSILKFRTMRDTDDAWASWKDGADGGRVTRFGRFLRNTHLDELPQFLNVLRGEMSVIGPRPEMVSIDAWAREHVPGFHRRLALKPGITGLSQVTLGYTGMDVEAYAYKLRDDELYREGLSLGMDLRVLASTVVWMLRGRGWRWRAREIAAERAGESAAA